MPTVTLTDKRVASLKATSGRIEYFDRTLPGFGLRVTPSGVKSWVLMYRVGRAGKVCRLTLGTYGAEPLGMSLAEARDKARVELAKADTGRDPGAEKQTAKRQTFGALADRYVEKYARVRKRSWRTDARMIRTELADWRDRPAASIRRADVRALLEGIVGRGSPVAANRALALVRKILNYGVDQEWIDVNPAARMARPAVETSRTRVLGTDELRRVLAWLDAPVPDKIEDEHERRHWRLNRAVLTLRLITAQRGAEVLALTWADVDLEAGWWTIPATVSKNKLPHRVPLTVPAVRVLAALLATAPADQTHIFTGIRGTRHRRGALDGLGLDDVRPHDFRRTAASTMASAGVARLVIAKVLNHIERGVTNIYDRHGYDHEKREALDLWARTLEALRAPAKQGAR